MEVASKLAGLEKDHEALKRKEVDAVKVQSSLAALQKDHGDLLATHEALVVAHEDLKQKHADIALVKPTLARLAIQHAALRETHDALVEEHGKVNVDANSGEDLQAARYSIARLETDVATGKIEMDMTVKENAKLRDDISNLKGRIDYLQTEIDDPDEDGTGFADDSE